MLFRSENGLGLLTYSVENPSGVGYTDVGYGEGIDLPLQPTLHFRSPDEDNALSAKCYVDKEISTDTCLNVVLYFAAGTSFRQGDLLYVTMQDELGQPYSIAVQPRTYVPVATLTSGSETLTLSPLGMSIRNAHPDREPLVDELTLRYQDGSEFTVESSSRSLMNWVVGCMRGSDDVPFADNTYVFDRLVDVDAVAKVRVMTDPEGIQLAMKNFLNMTEEDFNRAIVDSLQGNMREIIGTITLKEICNDRKKFGDEVQSKAQTDMNALGIQIISCNIQRVTDENSLINSLGQDNMSKIQKDAAIAKAEAERDIAIAQAQAAKASNDAQVEADMHIAQKQNDLAIKQSELKVQEDTKRAEADAAYTIQQQEQQRSIETATVNAQIAKTEREAELKSKEVEVKKQSLDAEVRAAADADRYRKEQEAQAALYQRQKDAEAVRYEQEQAAEAAKKAAEAARFAKEQEAAGIAAVGQAEAEAIRAKALAEAEGIDKKAEAMKKYGEAAVIEMIMNALPEIAKNVAEPLSKVDKITMYGEGNSAKLLSDIVNGTTQVTEGISAGMGLDLKSLLAGALGGKLAAGNSQPVQVTVTPQAQPDAAAASADTPEQQV